MHENETLVHLRMCKVETVGRLEANGLSFFPVLKRLKVPFVFEICWLAARIITKQCTEEMCGYEGQGRGERH